MELLIIMYWIAGFLFLFFGGALTAFVMTFIKLKKAYNKDMAIMIDKSNRYEIIDIAPSVASKRSMEYDKGKYFFKAGSGLLNKTGKVLYIFSEGKPNPMDISYCTSEWLDSTSIRGTINNEIIKELTQTNDPMKDTIQMLANFAAIGGAIVSLLIAAKMFGVLQ
jgi:hypothetical protein